MRNHLKLLGFVLFASALWGENTALAKSSDLKQYMDSAQKLRIIVNGAAGDLCTKTDNVPACLKTFAAPAGGVWKLILKIESAQLMPDKKSEDEIKADIDKLSKEILDALNEQIKK